MAKDKAKRVPFTGTVLTNKVAGRKGVPPVCKLKLVPCDIDAAIAFLTNAKSELSVERDEKGVPVKNGKTFTPKVGGQLNVWL